MSKFRLKRQPPLGKILVGDCRVLAKKLPDECVDLVICDPPYNIGVSYENYKDDKPVREYLLWSEQWLRQAHRVLKTGGAFWLFIGDEFAAELNVLCKQIGFKPVSWCVWWYSFGVNSPKKLTRSHVHIFYFSKGKATTFNAAAIKVPSMRQILYKDKRAQAGGRLPDDTWVLNEKYLPDGYDPLASVWVASRLCGTFKERRGTPNQLPAPILERIVKLSSNPGDIVADFFTGSGTTQIAAKNLDRKWFGYELSKKYADIATKALRK